MYVAQVSPWHRVWLIVSHVDFQVVQPTKNAQWANGNTYGVTWSKGLMDGVNIFDLELARMSTSGLILIAQNVNAAANSINLAFTGVPAADDYYLLFINSTHGVLYASSAQFSILDASSASSTNDTSKPNSAQPTVTVSGGPNPTAVFATTFAAVSGALPVFGAQPVFALSITFVCALVAGAWTLFST
ncbi:hypothetical protein K488DRAFT_43331 [Vararia minispora EC-137]|uniref:Uncharacterized protein n=1 Tax=Vararia minispora EC-137 TaxID=1314806 RepID=A0ACB8QU72_9AGAM|nr:hypothetical protein K488DRAFT_43331 [Vararia minispora EC-137]